MSDESVTRQLAAIFYADVSGYSRLTHADEIGTHRQLSASLDLIADRIRNAGGTVVHYAGDAVLARFQSVVAATHCAIGIQDAIRALCSEIEEEKRLLFRIGINLGEVIVDRNDIYGDGVNIAARLESLADAGGICISEAVLQHVQGKVDARFDDIGDQRLKNIERPVRAYHVHFGPDASAEGTDRTFALRRVSRFAEIAGPRSQEAVAELFARSEPPSIMIRPFRNLGGDAEQDALVDGIRLSIQSALVKLPGLFLINAPASEHYRNANVAAVKAGNEVGVRYVLDGAVQMAGEQIRVTIQLTDAPAAQIVWAERYGGVVNRIFEIQDEITTQVAVALDVKLVAGEASQFVLWERLPSRESRELALRALSHMYLGTESGNAVARRVFEELTALLPDSPQAMALAAYANWQSVIRGWSRNPAQSIASATTLAEKAIELGDPDGFARVVLASVRLLQRRHDEALALSESAASVRYSCPATNAVYSNVLHFCGHHARAIEYIKRALKQARVYPSWMAAVLAASYRDSGQLAASSAIADECLRFDPENLDAHVVLCTAHVIGGKIRKAEAVAQEILHIRPSFTIAGYLETQPYRESETLTSVAHALQAAGLPN